MQRYVAFGFFGLLAAVIVAGCGGGGGGGSTTPTLGGGTHGTQSAAFQVFIPQPPTANVARAPQYLAATTKSITIALTSVNGAPPAPAVPLTIFNVATPPCTTASGGISCTITVGAQVGTDLFTIIAYDATNGTGNVLSQGSVSVTVSAGSANNAPAVALGGNVAKVLVTAPPSATPAPNGDLTPTIDGTSNSIQVTVAAYDASGNLIVGSAPFASPIPITVTGNSGGALSYSPTSVVAPNLNVITLGTTGKMFYPTPGPGAPPTLTTASITFGPSGANGTTFIISPIQFDLPPGGLSNIPPGTVTIGVQEAAATSFTVNAGFNGSATSPPFAGNCGGTLTNARPIPPLPFPCPASNGYANFTLFSLAGGSGSINVTDNGNASAGTQFTALGSQVVGGPAIGYTVVLYNDLASGFATNAITVGPGDQHLWVALAQSGTAGELLAFLPQTSCASSPCTLVSSSVHPLPVAAAAEPSTAPQPNALIVGGDGNLWYTDLGTNLLNDGALGYVNAAGCLLSGCLIGGPPPGPNYGPAFFGTGLLSTSISALANGGDGNLYALVSQTDQGLTAVPYAAVSSGLATPIPFANVDTNIGVGTGAAITRGPGGSIWVSVDSTNLSFPNGELMRFAGCSPLTGTLTCATTPFPAVAASPPSGAPITPAGIVAFPPQSELYFLDNGSTGPVVVAPFLGSIAAGTSGTFSPPIPIPNAKVGSLGALILGPDGNLWFPMMTTSSVPQICRYAFRVATGVSPFYCVTIPPVGASLYAANALVGGPDGNIYFTVLGGAYVGEVVL